MLNIILIAVSLAMDCFAVSIAGGTNCKRAKLTDALKVGLSFGIFQAVMPLIGYFIGFGFKNFIKNVDHWIAFILLAAIGIKMLYETFKKDSDGEKTNITKMPTLLILSLATSIDAFVIGITIPFLEVSLLLSVAVIGFFAFVFAVAGYFLGNKIGILIGKKVEIIGGIILIGIGVKILLEHII